MNNLNIRIVTLAALAAITTLSLAQGPTSALYVTSGFELFRCQGDNVSSVITRNAHELALAVSGDIRTTSEQGVSGGLGSQYTLDTLDATGVSYSGQWLTFYDGACDGVNNYTIDASYNVVYRFDRNWQHGSRLFVLPISTSYWDGITCDLNGGFWASQANDSHIFHYSGTGALLGSFDTHLTSTLGGLAIDPNTGTLWTALLSGTTPTFYQFSTTGAQLGSVNYPLMRGAFATGMEFNVVPEPSSFLALTGGLTLLIRARRRSAR